jgi:hypothetical protein
MVENQKEGGNRQKAGFERQRSTDSPTSPPNTRRKLPKDRKNWGKLGMNFKIQE